jgi:integrase
MPQVLLDAAGRPRSPATVPGYHSGRSRRNNGQRYPAGPPPVAEIVAVMRHAGTGAYGARLRALIVVLWRAGLRIHEALALGEVDLDPRRGALLVRRGKGGRREVGMDDWGWEHLQPWLTARRPAGRSAAVHRHRPDPRTHMVPGRRPHRSTPGRRPRRCAPALRAAPAPPRARRRDGPRGRSADRDPAPARTHQPRDHLGIPTGHRQHRDHRHRPRPPPPDGPRRRNPPPLTAKAVEARPLR